MRSRFMTKQYLKWSALHTRCCVDSGNKQTRMKHICCLHCCVQHIPVVSRLVPSLTDCPLLNEKNRLRVVFLQHYNKYILFRQATSSWHLIIMQTLFVSGCNTLITFIFKWESTTVALTFKGKVCTQWISFPSQLTHIYYVEELLWFQTQRKTKKHWVWTHCGWFTSPWTPLSSNVHSTMQHHLLSASVCGSSCIIDSEVLSCTGLSKVFAQLISSTYDFWHIADISVGCSRLYGTW